MTMEEWYEESYAGNTGHDAYRRNSDVSKKDYERLFIYRSNDVKQPLRYTLSYRVYENNNLVYHDAEHYPTLSEARKGLMKLKNMLRSQSTISKKLVKV
jgi:hypothetical protein